MATVQITIPDALVPRVKAAWDGTFSRLKDADGNPIETDGAFFKRIIAEYTKRVVVHYEGQQAGGSAKTTAEAQASTDIVIT